MRERRIGDTCEQCDSTDGPFVLQHFSHEQPERPSMNGIVWDLMREYGVCPERPTITKQGCPECKSISIYGRQNKTPIWRCIKCHYEFDSPEAVDVQVNSKTGKEEYAKYKESRHKFFNDFKAQHRDVIVQRYGSALGDYKKERQNSYDKYVSGEGTARFCKNARSCGMLKG